MNDIFFSNSFHFRTLSFNKFHYTDNRIGTTEHYFAYMLCGKCKIVADTYSVEINAGDFFFIPYKCSYQSYWYGEPEIKFISLGFGYLPNFDKSTYLSQVLPYDSQSAKMFLSLAHSSPLCADDIGIFYTLVGRLLPKMCHTPVCRTYEIVEAAKLYLLNHPFASNSDIAKNCAVSEVSLYNAFKKSSNVTPGELKNHILLEKAKDMLISTDKSIEYISDFFNFSSSSYFRKKFKNYFGTTPRDMRKRNRI